MRSISVSKISQPQSSVHLPSGQRNDGEQELADVAKTLNPLDSTLMKNRTLTLFGEVNQDVSRRLSEKLFGPGIRI